MLLSVMEKKRFRVLKQIKMADGNQPKIGPVFTALPDHFELTRNATYERFIFNTCQQSKG